MINEIHLLEMYKYVEDYSHNDEVQKTGSASQTS